MGLLSIFGIKQKDKRNNHTFDDSDRQFSAEIRQAKRELELLKIERENELHKLKVEKQKLELQQEINELKGVFDDDDDVDSEDDSTTALIKLFAPMLLKNTQTSAQPTASNTSSVVTPIQSPLNAEQKKSIPDELLLKIWDSTPLVAKQYAKNSSDETVLKTIKKQLPDCDEDTYARALKVIRTHSI